MYIFQLSHDWKNLEGAIKSFLILLSPDRTPTAKEWELYCK